MGQPWTGDACGDAWMGETAGTGTLPAFHAAHFETLTTEVVALRRLLLLLLLLLLWLLR